MILNEYSACQLTLDAARRFHSLSCAIMCHEFWFLSDSHVFLTGLASAPRPQLLLDAGMGHGAQVSRMHFRRMTSEQREGVYVRG